ncbi:hypothetical protein PG985_002729 [Apiospora marii]|uniref:uncharacterized protein n=1 Tax=Apiospora marii TaxID=335849 RepID=UPI003130BAD0
MDRPYESVQTHLQSTYSPSQTLHAKHADQSLTPAQLPWRPIYLRRTVILGFIGIFAAIIAALEALLAVSNRRDGIATSQPNEHYLWTYGPIAFLTLVGALWGRAEYQSKLVAPWQRLMQPSADSKHTLLLDYVSGFPLLVVFQALRNKDWTVSITCTVSLMLKILIVISTGLITLSWTGVHLDDHPMVAQDTFSTNNARLSNAGSLSYHVMKGLIGGNLTYQEGMSKDYAFQSVVTNLPDPADTRVTVDGLRNGLDCVLVDVVLTGALPPDPHYADTKMNLTVTSPGCSISKLQLGSPNCPGSSGYWSSCVFGRFAKVQCDGTRDDEGARVLLMFGNITYTRDYSRNTTDYTGRNPTHPLVAKLPQSTQMLCVPTYAIHRVDVVRNGTRTRNVELAPSGENRTLDGIPAWEIMNAHYSAYHNTVEGSSTSVYGTKTNISTAEVDVDEYFGVAIDSQLDPNMTTQVSDMFNPGFLEQFAESYYRQFGAIVAKQSLMEPASIEISGSAVFMANRLVVREWSAQWMAGLTAACLVLSVVLLFTVPKQGILPRNPSNIPDAASLLLHSHDLQSRVRDFGAADEKSLVRGLDQQVFQSGVTRNPVTGQAEFAILDQQPYAEDASQARNKPLVRARHNLHPGILHPVTRSTLCLILIGLIITLELLLQKSNREDGLGDVGNDTYIHYLWTTLPALTFGLTAMAFSSMDFQIRSLAPYMMLKRTVTTDAFMGLDHLNMSIPRTIYKEARSGNIGALATTTVLLVSSLFTIFSGSLFQALAVPNTISIALRADQSFDPLPKGSIYKENAFVSLILDSNLSYPSFTHEDLAFPQFLPDVAMESNPSFDPLTAAIKTVVPAVRSRLDCRLYDFAKHRTNLTLNHTIAEDQNPLGVWVEGEECNLKSSDEEKKYNIRFPTYSNTTYIGKGDRQNQVATPILGCSEMMYSWGKIDYSATPVVQHLSSLGCNVTFESVDVDVNFIGADLKIDTAPGKAPRPRENTARDSTMSVGDIDMRETLFHIYYRLAAIPTAPQLLDPFFSTLVTSRYAVAIEDLGEPNASARVADAIRFQHGVIQAQKLAMQRLPATWSNVTLPPDVVSRGNNASDADPRYAATATDTTGRRRVVQDAVSTRALEALLGIALVLLVVGWCFMHQTDVLPRAPTSIASMAALVAGGNVLEKLPADAEWRSRSEIAAALKSSAGGGGGRGEPRFWIGWGLVPDLEGRALGGESENGFRRFGIYAVGEDEAIGEDGSEVANGGQRHKRLREQVTAYDGTRHDRHSPGERGGVSYNPY